MSGRPVIMLLVHSSLQSIDEVGLLPGHVLLAEVAVVAVGAVDGS